MLVHRLRARRRVLRLPLGLLPLVLLVLLAVQRLARAIHRLGTAATGDADNRTNTLG